MTHQINAAWKNFAATKTITARHTLTYIILRADGPTEALFHIRRAFSAIKSPKKLANGRKPYDCLWTADNFDMAYCLHSMPNQYLRDSVKRRIEDFGIEATDELIEKFISTATETLKRIK